VVGFVADEAARRGVREGDAQVDKSIETVQRVLPFDQGDVGMRAAAGGQGIGEMGGPIRLTAGAHLVVRLLVGAGVVRCTQPDAARDQRDLVGRIFNAGFLHLAEQSAGRVQTCRAAANHNRVQREYRNGQAVELYFFMIDHGAILPNVGWHRSASCGSDHVRTPRVNRAR